MAGSCRTNGERRIAHRLLVKKTRRKEITSKTRSKEITSKTNK
jgi:hypothetical protein